MSLLRDGAIGGWSLGQIGAPSGGRIADGIGSQYPDEGCSLAPRCLECPLPACCYDLPPKRADSLMREARLTELFAQGYSADECAVIMGIARRTIFRLQSSIKTNRQRQPMVG